MTLRSLGYRRIKKKNGLLKLRTLLIPLLSSFLDVNKFIIKYTSTIFELSQIVNQQNEENRKTN
jgi:hypothetical protein